MARKTDDARLLAAWEQGSIATAATRGAQILATLEGAPVDGPRSDGPAYVDLSLGTVDRLLLEFHLAEFGRALEGYFGCPRCGEELEIEVDIEALLASPPPPPEGPGWRYPTPRMLQIAAASVDPSAAIVELAAGHREAGVAIDETRVALADQLANADPLLDVQFGGTCVECGSQVSTRLDVGSFLVAALGERARRILIEVDRLARAYGWSETDILAMSALRRRRYLSLVGSGHG